MFNVTFHAMKSMQINCSVEQAFDIVSDFKTWPTWSPWLCQEKDAKVTLLNDKCTKNHSQEWNGKLVGSGKMTLNDFEKYQALKYDIEFYRPFKTKNKVIFDFEKESENVTLVTWKMIGNLPFVLFFMKKMMSSWIENDFKRGLIMLKDYLEEGKVETSSNINNVILKNGFYYIGKKYRTKIDVMPEKMKESFSEFKELITSGKMEKPKNYISLYHKWDFSKGECEFTCAMEYLEEPQNHEGYIFGKFNNHKSIEVLHNGSYKYLGNSWATAMSYQKANRLKNKKTIPWYERYKNDLENVEEKNLITEVNIPVR